jgi:ribulose-5-phosphate 4-epimerase/fuculose-1-phosphate aldolase
MNHPAQPLADALFDLVLANKILAYEDTCDAWGHVSIRHPDHPDRYLLSCSRSPEFVAEDDIVEHRLDGQAVHPETRALFYERFIHGAIYEAYPAVQSVIHSHADDVLPFSISPEPLRCVMASGKYIGATIPVWDIDEHFGEATDMMVTDMDKGRDLAKRLAGNTVALMRGHGFVTAGRTLLEAVNAAVYLPRNARIQMAAMQMGNFKPLTAAEVATRENLPATASGPQRGWEYWCRRVGLPYTRPGGFALSSALR